MHATRKVKLRDMTPNLTCNLCHGYFVDATTIIECLHSFCRSCIVKYLEGSEFCPVCDVHCSSKPLTSIRSDQMLQEIVYKLVPGLFQSEMTKRREFYKQNPTTVPTNQLDAGHTNESYITSDDIIQLSLEYYSTDAKLRESTKRYVKCPAAVSIAILKKLIHGKFDLNNSVQIDVMYGDRILPEDFLLMDIAYKYSWTQNGNKPLQLSYRLKGLFPDKNPVQLPKQLNKIPRKYNGISKMAPNITQDAKAQKRVKSSVMTPVNSNGPKMIKEKNSKGKRKSDSITSTPTPFKLPPKGERKRKLSREIEMELIIESNNNSPDKSPARKQPRYEPNNNNEHEMMITNSSGNEVQLRISENGIISATSIISTPNYERFGNGNGIDETILQNASKKPLKSYLNDKSIGKNESLSSRNNSNNSFDQTGNLVNGSQHKKLKKAKVDKISNGKGTSEGLKKPKVKAKNQNLESGQQQEQKSKKPFVPGPGSVRISMAGGSPHEKPCTNGLHTSNKLLQQLQSPKKSDTGLNSAVMKRIHNTSTLNGDLKFTTNTSPLKNPLLKSSSTSPIRLPQNINGVEIIPIGAPNQTTPNKKPPKFFKSRASITELAPQSLNEDHKMPGSSPISSVTDTITNSSPFSALNLLHTNTANNLGCGIKSSLSPNAGANTIETTATTSVMVPIPMSSSYNSSAYRYPSNATLPWSTSTGSMLMNQHVPLNIVPYNLMPYYNMQNSSAMQFTAAAIQQQLHIQQMQQQQRNSLAAQLISNQSYAGQSAGSNNNNNNTLDLSSTNRKQAGTDGHEDAHVPSSKVSSKKISKGLHEQTGAHLKHNGSPHKKSKLVDNGNSVQHPKERKKHKSPSTTPTKNNKTNLANGISSGQKPVPIAPALIASATNILAILPPEIKFPSPSKFKSPEKEALIPCPAGDSAADFACDSQTKNEEPIDIVAMSLKSAGAADDETNHPTETGIEEHAVSPDDKIPETPILNDVISVAQDAPNLQNDLSRNENSCSPALVIAEPEVTDVKPQREDSASESTPENQEATEDDEIEAVNKSEPKLPDEVNANENINTAPPEEPLNSLTDPTAVVDSQ